MRVCVKYTSCREKRLSDGFRRVCVLHRLQIRSLFWSNFKLKASNLNLSVILPVGSAPPRCPAIADAMGDVCNGALAASGPFLAHFLSPLNCSGVSRARSREEKTPLWSGHPPARPELLVGTITPPPHAAWGPQHWPLKTVVFLYCPGSRRALEECEMTSASALKSICQVCPAVVCVKR